jgi:hypothetical protein
MGKYGTNLEGFGAFEGGVNADNGATLVSTNSDGEKSLLLGPAASGEVLSNIANGNFEVLPNNPSAAISEENPLPYFTVTDGSSGRIVATTEPSTLAVGQSILRFTLTSAVANDTLMFSRYVPIPTSEARSFGGQFRVAAIAATSSANYSVRISAQYVLADQVTTTGTEATVDYTGSQMNAFIAALGTFGAEIYRNPNGNGSAPADAAFLLIKFGIVVTGNVASAAFDISETRIDLSRIQYMMTDQINPDDYGYAGTFLSAGIAKFVSNELGPIGSRPELQLNVRSGDVVLKTTAQGYTISLTSASRTGTTVTIVTTRAHGFSTGYEVVVAGITGTPGTTMNGTFIVTVTNTTTFTYTAAGTAGSGTVTSATVKSGPGTGIIYLQPAATAAGRVQVDGRTDITGKLAVGGDITATGEVQSSSNIYATAYFFTLVSGAPYLWTGGSTNARLISAGNTAGTGGADIASSATTTRSGVLITKATAGQPTTNLNGTGTTDAFADALRNGGLAIDTTNNRGYWYSSGWKYTALTTPSDSRLKEEITDITGALDTLRQLVPVAFKWKRPEAHGRAECVSDDGTRMGFIADQVATTDLAHWVETLGVDEREADLVDTEDVLAVNIPQNEMEALLVQALLDIDTRLKALESR